MNIAMLLGKQIKAIKLVPDTVFEAYDDEILADEVIIDLGEYLLSILPLPDTDELKVQIIERPAYRGNVRAEPILKQYINAKLSYTWEGVNTNGYQDVFMVAFDTLTPAIMILCEGSVLKLFEFQQVNKHRPK